MNLSKRLQKPLALLLAFTLVFGSVSWNAFAEAGEAAPDGVVAGEAVSAEIPEEEVLEAVDAGEIDGTSAEEEPAEPVTEGEPAVVEKQLDEAAGGEGTDGAITDEDPEADPDVDATKADPAEEDLLADEAEDPAPLLMRGAPKEVPATVTSLTIQNSSGEDINKVFWTDTFHLAMKWDASSSGADLHKGDYFDITLPDQMIFPSDSSACDFNIYGDDGTTVIATAHVDPGATGGTVRVTFTDWVEGKENVKGNIHLAARFDRTQVITDEENTFQIQIGSQVVPVTVTVVGPKELHDELLSKWGQSTAGSKEQAEWWVRINHMKANLTNVVIEDRLSEGAGRETYIADSFVLMRVEMDNYGNTSTVHQTINLADGDGRLSISADGRSFTLNLGNVNGDQYRLRYRTTYVPGTTLRNNMEITSTEQSKTTTAIHHSADSGGSGTGNLANKIKIIKVDAENNSILLAGAVFEVERPDGTTFELTTGADGTVTSGTLTSGTYKVREKTPPEGYVANSEVFTLVVNSEAGAILTVSNEPIRINIAVAKKWVGPEGGPVTVRLLADGEPNGRTLELSTDNGWMGSFDNLRRYNPDGSEIVYTIEEPGIENYASAITGSAEGGFTVTNTNTETIDISGAKTWDDANDQDGVRPGSIAVRLLADGTEVASTTVTSADNWAFSFPGLPKYNPDGSEIVYTVTEDAVENYSTTIDGYAITNSYTPGKTSVTVVKEWDDANNQDGKRPGTIMVRLYANGQPSGDAVELSDGNQWTYTWTELDQKANGRDIVYTVEEVEVPEGYSSDTTGDAVSGYTITNTYTPETIDIDVEKTWIGPKLDEVTVILLAGGEEAARMTLSEANGWKGTFESLPKYKDGSEIVYTIEEPGIENYASAITGSAEEGFTVTNTNTETVDIPVEKTWIGPKLDEITVILLADGEETDETLTLNEANGWKGTFEGLPKYNPDGSEIVYTIEEPGIENYASAITGSAEEGFTVTNTNTETVDIGVVKKWVGTPAAGATVQLKADGKVVAEVTLTASSGWAHTFAGLPKYNADGTEIVYTLTETPIPGYSTAITGDAASGFSVTNTREIPPGVPNTGDGLNPLLWSSLAIAGLLMAAATRLRSWRKNM